MLFISDCSITIVWSWKCDYIVYSHGQCRKVTYHRFSFTNKNFFPEIITTLVPLTMSTTPVTH